MCAYLFIYFYEKRSWDRGQRRVWAFKDSPLSNIQPTTQMSINIPQIPMTGWKIIQMCSWRDALSGYSPHSDNSLQLFISLMITSNFALHLHIDCFLFQVIDLKGQASQLSVLKEQSLSTHLKLIYMDISLKQEIKWHC